MDKTNIFCKEIGYDRDKIRYDIKNDIIFKNIFGKIENEKYTAKLIELITEKGVKTIDVSQDVSLGKIIKSEKEMKLDVRAIINGDTIVNIEMQRKDEGNMQERSEKYGSSIYSRNVKIGEKYEKAKEVILINILNYKINEHKEYISDTVTVLRNHRETEIKTKIKYYFIELPKLERKKLDMEDELVQWLVYIYGKNRRLVEMALNKNKMLREIDKEVYYLQGEEAEARLQEMHENWEFTKRCAIRDAEERGEKRGEKREIINTAKKMLKMKISNEIIMQVTGLTNKELMKISI